MVASILYDQFNALNKDFRRALRGGGEFRGSVGQFRRRHHQLVQSVKDADRFAMVSNVTVFCCQITNVILILYCTVFFRDETVGEDAMSAVMYVYWLASTLFSLTLTACEGVAINHAVCCYTVLQ